MGKMKTKPNPKRPKTLLASKKERLNKMKPKKNSVKRPLKQKTVGLRTKKVKKHQKIVKKKEKKKEDEPIIEHFPSEDYMNLNSQVFWDFLL